MIAAYPARSSSLASSSTACSLASLLVQLSKVSWKLLGSVITGRVTWDAADADADAEGDALPAPDPAPLMSPADESPPPPPPPHPASRSAAVVVSVVMVTDRARRATVDLPRSRTDACVRQRTKLSGVRRGHLRVA